MTATFAAACHLLADAVAADWRHPGRHLGTPDSERVAFTRDEVVTAITRLASDGPRHELPDLWLHPQWFARPRLLGHWTL